MKGQFSVKQLTKYVSYARRNCHPRMTDAAKQRLIEHYVEMRKAGMRNKTVTSLLGVYACCLWVFHRLVDFYSQSSG